ncbi:MAG: hypothetical protein M1828_000605 [Chrysothrix sp. TS-e1954]|nr:MAG: hypothetical protein M1828_000605 [Chrysothrix sp. TS-e1954]
MIHASLNGGYAPSENHSVYPTPRRKRSSSSPARAFESDGVKDALSNRRLTTNAEEFLDSTRQEVQRLSSAKLQELTSQPDSIPVRAVLPTITTPVHSAPVLDAQLGEHTDRDAVKGLGIEDLNLPREISRNLSPRLAGLEPVREIPISPEVVSSQPRQRHTPVSGRPHLQSRALSTPIARAKTESRSDERHTPRQTDASSSEDFPRYTNGSTKERSSRPREPSSPNTPFLPAPPLSMPTYLQLELASERPSPLYIQRSHSYSIPFEATQVKFQRLLNFLLLPPKLEQVLLFGALTCLDAWLYTFTILPLRFFKAFGIFFDWACKSCIAEVQDLSKFIYDGIVRVWHRRRRTSSLPIQSPFMASNEALDRLDTLGTSPSPLEKKSLAQPSTAKAMKNSFYSHRRARSITSTLQQNHKVDFLQGLLVIISSVILMKFDASRMYHNIRGQAAIKLYVIYNVLEVCDRLFSALGQDILECLFSPESLERNPITGRSKIKRPFWLFLLALVYSVIHATALFYQVITLNVAVNSYSNALLTLLMSNQFVEIKGTVFKKIEKENLFQLTCADVVERFQLWLMLLIIALRNIVEVGGLSIPSLNHNTSGPSSSTTNHASPPNATATTGIPTSSFSILPDAFTIMPSLLPFQVLTPFMLVLGSEMLVDWLKHAYITKFNATSPRVYGRFFDVLAKDYYSNAFAEQNLTKRLGLPVIPLACLFIRAMLQTYHMFLATNISPPLVSTSTSLAVEAEPTTSPILAKLDTIFRRALGQSSFGGGNSHAPSSLGRLWSWSIDDVIALTTMLLFFLALYLLLLAFKLVLGMVLLSAARARYANMKQREAENYSEPGTKRLGGWGVTEVGDENKRHIKQEDPNELRMRAGSALRDRDKDGRRKDGKGDRLERVERYDMVAKRIW